MKKDTTIKDRLVLYIKHLGLSQRKFEILCNLSNGYVNNIRESISPTKLQQIALHCKDLNTGWLMTGNGDMIESAEQKTKPSQSVYHTLPLITIDAVAGFPSVDEAGVTLDDCEFYNIPEFFSKGAQYLIRVSGSSMYPNYNNGDILACRKIDDITFFQWGKVYVLDTSQGALVKRLFEDSSNEENVICHSDNTEQYPNFKLPKSEIRSLSIVVGVIRIE